jgi:hypothetical protein
MFYIFGYIFCGLWDMPFLKVTCSPNEIYASASKAGNRHELLQHGWEAYICSVGYQWKITKSAQTTVFCEWKCNKDEGKVVDKCFQ